MAHANAVTMLAASLLVALLAARGSATSAANLTAGDGLQCPAVCPACPACPSAPPCPRRIPPGYQLHEGLGYYKMHYESLDWLGAKAACEREGGYLVVLNSQREADMASRFLTRYSLGEFLLVGFFDVTAKGKYLTVLDQPLSATGYAVWAPGEPNNVGKENCGSLKRNKGLNDGHCSGTKRPFLCELFV